MSRETCIKCETYFMEAVIENWDIALFLDWNIEDLNNNMCIKCLARITSRYEDII